LLPSLLPMTQRTFEAPGEDNQACRTSSEHGLEGAMAQSA
jgi:hypothetical protein